MPRYAVYRFDVTTLNEEQRNMLDMMVTTQAEASDYDVHPDTSEGIENYPDVEVQQLCPWCYAVLVGGECGGEGEGICNERACVEDYDPKGLLVEAYVRDFCSERCIENALVPYRNDGLTYFDQLAYLVREYHGLEQPKKASRRLP